MMNVRKYSIGFSCGLLCCMGSFLAAEVIDFTHLLEDVDESAPEELRSVREAPPVGGGHEREHVLASRVAELEQVVITRDRQIAELKQALEELTATFSARMTEMRLAERSQDSDATSQLQDSLNEKSRALAKARRELAALQAAKDQNAVELEKAIAAFEKEHEQAVMGFELMHAEAIAAFESEREQLTKGFEEEREQLISTFEAKHERVIASLRKEHEQALSVMREEHAERAQSAEEAHAQAIATLQQERDDSVGTLKTDLRQAKASLEEQRENAGEVLSQLRASLQQEHQQALASLEQKQSADVSTLEKRHAAELATAKAAYETLRADTARDREDARRLRQEVSRLEAALDVTKRDNERERFLLAYNSGSLFMAAGRHQRAEEELLKALSIREDDAALHYNLGVLYDEHLRQPSRARRHYERFLELAPNDRDAPVVMQWLRELR